MSTDYFQRYGGSAPENYQRYFVPAISAPLAAELLELAALRPAERVLDVACGTGAVTRLALERVGPQGSVAGLDPNGAMLEVARASTPGGAAAIAWHQAGAQAMPLADGSCDAVLCQLGLQFMSDRAAALREMRRVLVSGGRMISMVVGPTPPLFDALGQALGRHVSPQSTAFVSAVFALHDRDELSSLISDAGFAPVEVRVRPFTLKLPPAREFLWQYVQSTPLSTLVAQADDGSRAALERELVAAWQPFASKQGLDCPIDVVLATARA